MATVNYHLTNGVYPFGGEENPELVDLLGYGDANLSGSITSTSATYLLSTGLYLRLRGTGFTVNGDGDLSDTGTLTGFDVFMPDGSTLIVDVSLTLSMETFYDAQQTFAPGDLARFLLNGADTFNGSDGADVLRGHAGNDILNGGNGNDDFIDGDEGVDTYDGGAGTGDQLSFASAYGNVRAYRGIDLNVVAGTVIDPWGNSETFTNFESYRGSQFADVMVGSGADEQFMGLGGKDTIDGGGGFDVVRYHRDVNQGGMSGVTVNLATGTAVDGFGRTDTLINIEGARGTQFGDTFVGNGLANRFQGDAGNDTFEGGGGADRLEGGAGEDTASYASATAAVTADLSNSSSNTGDAAGDTYVLIENLVGSNFADTLNGDSFANRVTGGGGKDAIAGGGGNDKVYGGADNDGVYGNDGDDYIVGGAGNDRLGGGAGSDIFVFESAFSSRTNIDTITDFTNNKTQNDVMWLDNAIFTNFVTTGAIASGNFVSNGAALDSNDYLVYNSSNGNLYYDPDGSGSGSAILFAQLSNRAALTYQDFSIV